jgi:hypothetical protein
MTTTTKIKIDSLGKRVKWMMENCQFDATFIGFEGAPFKEDIGTNKALLGFVRTVLNGEDSGYPSEQNWNKYMSGEVAIGVNVINAIMTIYPSMPRNLLTTGNFHDFQAVTERLEKGRDRWNMATAYVENHRGVLAETIKRFYTGVDASPDFPLVTDKGWILDNIRPLHENDTPPPFSPSIAAQHGSELDGWIGTYTYIKKSRMSGDGAARLWNGAMYRVMEVNAHNGQLSFSLAPGAFYDYIDTCEVLGAEFADYILKTPNRSPQTSDLQMRGQPEDAFRLWTRMAPLGVSCLCILKNYPFEDGQREQNVFLMHERGKNTAAGQNTWHVAPAGGHAPVSMTDNDPRQRTLWSTVVREFVEECFDIEDAQKMAKDYNSFITHKNVRPFIDNIFRQKGVANIFLMGVGLDPVTMGLEALAAIVIDWKKADRSDWSGVLHAKSLGSPLKMRHSYEAKGTFIPLLGPESLLSAINRTDGKPVQPAGQACLLQGARFYDHLMSFPSTD